MLEELVQLPSRFNVLNSSTIVNVLVGYFSNGLVIYGECTISPNIYAKFG